MIKYFCTVGQLKFNWKLGLSTDPVPMLLEPQSHLCIKLCVYTVAHIHINLYHVLSLFVLFVVFFYRFP